MSRGSICQAGVLDPETGKLSAPAEPLGGLAQRFDYVLAEADGSKRLPLKAHAAREPVIPAGTANVVWVVGASGLSKPINEAVHRPELFCERCGCELTDIATPERVAQVLNAEMQALKLSTARVMLNQVDTLSRPHDGRPLRGSSRPPRRRQQPQVAGPISSVAVKYGLFGRPTAANSPYFTATEEGTRHLCC